MVGSCDIINNNKLEVVILADSNDVDISLPKEVAEKLKQRAKSSGFSSLSSYVTYILRQVISNIEAENQEKDKKTSKEDEEKVKDNLKGMGYLK